MARPDEDRRRELRAGYKRVEKAAWEAGLPLERDDLEALLDHLDTRLGERPCDHSFRETQAWVETRGIEWESVEAGLVENAAGCDCEVLANLDPDTRV